MPFDPSATHPSAPVTSTGNAPTASHSVVVNIAFGLVGIGLLAGAAAAYYFIIHRPLTWPRADALVVSSRVVNPRQPSQYSPELVLRIEGDAARELTIVPNWSSGSYEMVRSYIDGYPAGKTVLVAINPDDATDVRHELGATLTNIILPAALGFMGLLFAGIGWATRPGRAGPITAPPNAQRQSVGWIGTLFMAIGVILASIGGWLLMQDTALDWPTTEAEAVEGGILAVRSSSSRGSSSQTSYDIQVTFRYEVDGRTYKSQTTSGSTSGTREAVQERLAAYAAGTKHAISYRPNDPNVIRFELSAFDVYIIPVVLLAVGSVFLGIGFLVSRKLTASEP